MKSINKVILSGHVAEKPELNPRSQFAVTNVKINVVESKKDQRSGQWVNETNVMEVTFFGDQANELVRSLQPNDFIVVEGKVRVSERKSQSGTTFMTTSIQGVNYDVMSGNGAPVQRQQPAPRAAQQPSGGNVYQNSYQEAQTEEETIPF